MLKQAIARSLPHPIYRAVRRRRVAREISSFPPRDHDGTFGNARLRLRFEDPLAAGWYGTDRDELPEIAHLRALDVLAPGATVFDLGAHQGVVALEFLASVAPGGRVIAVEAEPHNARMAEVNRSLNDADGLTVVHAAVTDHTGTVTFAEGLNGEIDERTKVGNVEVPAVTIDSLCERYGRPDVVVLDIEGHEGVALRAAGAAAGATFVVEVHVGQLAQGTSAQAIVDGFGDCRRWISRGGTFEPYEGAAPQERFFLIAQPEA